MDTFDVPATDAFVLRQRHGQSATVALFRIEKSSRDLTATASFTGEMVSLSSPHHVVEDRHHRHAHSDRVVRTVRDGSQMTDVGSGIAPQRHKLAAAVHPGSFMRSFPGLGRACTALARRI